ncbi:hypothetical protein RQP46_003559 [Phenoliferia psychrophenolica]
MDPSAFLNQPPPPMAAPPQPQPLPNGNGIAPAPSPATTPAAAATAALNGNGVVAMEVEESGQEQSQEAVEAVVEERPKTKKELEQDKKDLELGELLDMMDDWRPVVSLLPLPSLPWKRLLALAAQRFVSSISSDAFQYARTRTAAGPGGRAKDAGGSARAKDRTRTVLTMEDLSAALKEYGVGAERAPFYL